MKCRVKSRDQKLPWWKPLFRRGLRASRARHCFFERLSDRILLHGGSLAASLAIELDSETVGQIEHPGESVYYEFALAEPGRLRLHTHGLLDTRTSLLGSDGQLLIQSDGRSPADPSDLIIQHLLEGTYYVRVEGLAGGAGPFALAADFHQAIPPQDPLQVNFDRDYPFALMPPSHTAGDFNGDGRLDVATANLYTSDVSVLLGVGDGAFQAAQNYPTGFFPIAIAAADIDGDGLLDLVTANQLADSVSILAGRGDGTFGEAVEIPAGSFAFGLGVADFNEDGRLDLFTVNIGASDVSVLLQDVHGHFPSEQRFATGDDPGGNEVADLNHDGYLDLVVGNFESNDVSVLLGKGNGTFQPQRRFPTGRGSTNRIAVGDYNADGHPDLATSNAGSDDVSILLGNGQGDFFSDYRVSVGRAPFGVVTADFNGDGRPDLANVNRQSNDVAVLIGRGDGTFEEQVRYRVGLQPWNILIGDFNGDGHDDLSTANSRSHDVSVLLGLGDGTFLPEPVDHGHGETNPQGMVARDFNEDGWLDLVTVSYTGGHAFVYLGRGDGTFHERARFNVGATPVEVVAGDFNGDGHLDVATANCDTSDASVLLGNGDGTFQDEVRYPASASSEFILAGDFNGDGLDDLVNSGQFAHGAALLLGRADGTFEDRILFAQSDAPADSAAADFNSDGRLDVAFANYYSPDRDVAVYFGGGDGSFSGPERIGVGEFPLGLVAGDFDRDGHADLAVTNTGSSSVSVILGRGDGTFERPFDLATGNRPDSVIARDLDADGALDLVVSNAGTDEVWMFLGHGDGVFESEQRFLVGDGPTPRRGLETGDFNGDRLLDVAIPQVLSNDVAILLGDDDGRLAGPLRFAVGLGPVAIAVGDTSGDGRLDVASVNPTTSELTIFQGAGDGTLRSTIPIPVGDAPVAVVHGDFNRDGRLDVATANQASSDVSVLLGLGTGTFQDQQRVPVGEAPTALVAGDFNGDGLADLAVANSGSGDLSILLGRNDGTFQSQSRVPAGIVPQPLPQALATGDFDRDGWLDLAVADYRLDTVLILSGRGDGTFQPPLPSQMLSVGRGPVTLLAADINGDTLLDLSVANYLSSDVTLLAGLGNGLFDGPKTYATGTAPVSIAAGDYDRDGRIDLATANSSSDDVTLLLARNDGTFAAPLSRSVGDYPVGLVSADFNDDARLDLALATHLEFEVSVLQGLGDASFAAAGALSNPRLSAPLVADWNHDGAADTVVLNREGQIILRLARPTEPGLFQAPMIVNPSADLAARDIAFVTTPSGLVLAALDARHASVSLYSLQAGRTFTRSAGPTILGTLPIALRAGDLSGDSRDDLAVVAAGSGQVLVYVQRAAGFTHQAPDFSLAVGASPSSLELTDLGGDGRLDITVTNQFSGDVSVLVNDPAAPFARELRFRAADGIFALAEWSGQAAVRSALAPADVIGGDFDRDGFNDLIVASGGANKLTVLRGNEAGGLFNPADDLTYATGLQPLIVVTGSLNGDAYPDLAVLNEQSANVSIFLGTSEGKLSEVASSPLAGNVPTGLAVSDINRDGRQDLLVGNDFGDLLVLLGNGDGTFQPYQRADGGVALAVADVDGDGREDFIFASQATDLVEVQYSQTVAAFRQLRSDGLLAPAAVATADLDRDGALDLIIANSGANNVLVYRGTSGGQFAAALSFFAGTSPASVTVQELNGDALPDLVVANEGSNDVTVLLGQASPAGWTLAQGPRLRAGSGPVQAIVQDETSDGVPDILVTNKQSSDVYLLAGLGLGFFDDRNPVIRQTGQQPEQIVPLPGGGIATVNVGSNNVTVFPSFLSSPAFTIGSGGNRPVAVLAGNFNGDAFSDLIVAHQGDGVIQLLAGGPGGFSLGDSFSHGDLPHPAALASVFRGELIDVYGVNERGTQAVLIASLDLVPALADPTPVPLSGLLLVVGPGFELAMSVLTAEAVAVAPQVPGAGPTAEPADSDDLLTFAEGSGSDNPDPNNRGDDQAEPDAKDGEDWKMHDAAILDLLSGLADSLALRPPSLPLDEVFDLGTSNEAATGQRPAASWLPESLVWLAIPDAAQLVGLFPLPPGLGPVAGATLAVVRQWLHEFVVARTFADAVMGDGLSAAQCAMPASCALAPEPSASEPLAADPGTLDPWLAAVCALGLVHGVWTMELRRRARPNPRPAAPDFHIGRVHLLSGSGTFLREASRQRCPAGPSFHPQGDPHEPQPWLAACNPPPAPHVRLPLAP